MHPVETLLVPVGRLLRRRRPDEAASITNAPELATDDRLTLTSPAFGDGEDVPTKHCSVFIGEDVSPALAWSALPAGTKALLFLLEDLDNPGRVPGVHTVATFAPVADGLPEGALTPSDPHVQFLRSRPRPARYVGPRPLPGHGTHRYRFHLYALDTEVDLADLSGVLALPAALAGHVLASGTLMGTRTS